MIYHLMVLRIFYLSPVYVFILHINRYVKIYHIMVFKIFYLSQDYMGIYINR